MVGQHQVKKGKQIQKRKAGNPKLLNKTEVKNTGKFKLQNIKARDT